jgi:adenylosuccinate synthase
MGFHPYTTWSRCTAENALNLIKEMVPDSSVFQIGVMRSYAVRHGPGPLPTETNVFTSIVSDHNKQNEWQGTVRYGWFDAVLARYALEVAGKIDTLAVTHMDMLQHLTTWKYCAGYAGSDSLENMAIDTNVIGGNLKSFRLRRFLQLEQREQITKALSAVVPILETCVPNEGKVIRRIESLLGQPIGIISRGPSAEDIQILNPMPM